MYFVAALPQELDDAVTIASGCSLLFGAITWAVGKFLIIFLNPDLDLQRWVLDGLGGGAVIGLAMALLYLVL